MERLAEFVKSVLAGVMISIGGFVFLSCDNKYVGALAFCVGLISIVLLGMNLYTGRIGYTVTSDLKQRVDTAISVVGNLVGCVIVGLLSSPVGKVAELCTKKLEKSWPRVFFDAVMCGVLIYVCVEIYKRHKTVVGIVFCIPTFILCGFEHSVADMFYFINGRSISWRSALFILLVAVGNGVGSILFHLALLLGKKYGVGAKEEKQKEAK